MALVVLTALGAATTLVGGLGMRVGRGIVTAAAGAVLQLAVVSAVIVAVVRSLWLSAAFVLLMLVVAAATSARRMTDDRSGLLAVVPIASGAAIVLAIVLLTGVVPPVGIAVVPVGGIVLGGAMTATSLTGRRALDELDGRRGEYEAALGLLERDAALLITRPSAAQALTPAMDQTRTVGLVTLPGAFVGVLLGSGDPVQAAAAQVLVLVGAGGRRRRRRDDRRTGRPRPYPARRHGWRPTDVAATGGRRASAPAASPQGEPREAAEPGHNAVDRERAGRTVFEPSGQEPHR